MAQKKFTWLLLLQGWTMLWVVIGHAPLSQSVFQTLVWDDAFHSLAVSVQK